MASPSVSEDPRRAGIFRFARLGAMRYKGLVRTDDASSTVLLPGRTETLAPWGHGERKGTTGA